MKLVTFGIDKDKSLIVISVYTTLHATTTDTISARNSTSTCN